MIQSQNKKVDLTIKASSYNGWTSYGTVMIGDAAFEYYNEKKPTDYVQIPWTEVDYVAASVLFRGKIIPRFMIMTKTSGKFIFSTRDNKKTLRAINQYVRSEDMLRSLSFFDVVKRGIFSLFRRKK